MNEAQAKEVLKQVVEAALKGGVLGLNDAKTAIVALETLEAENPEMKATEGKK